ncbi:MAG: 50S ribosomal protein L11 methyltransferase [Deltaproteobacteria bacterium]|nr:50S ribosomal protein L11 methyltransferase [Deltaproteobacteria bacterium]
MAWRCLVATAPREVAAHLEAILSVPDCLGTERRAPDGAPWPVGQPWEAGPPPALPPVVEILAWFEEEVDLEELVGDVRSVLSDLPGAGVALRRVQAGDWEECWRHGFQPFALSNGLVVGAPWNAPPGALVVEPGMAFGTGEHPTTRAALEAIVRLARRAGTCLDVGCGSGILSLAAARLGMAAEGIDADPEAVRAARCNGLVNDLPCRFDDRPVRCLSGRWDLVVANLFAECHRRLASDLVRLTGRHLVLAGILEDRLPGLLDGVFAPLSLAGIQRDGEWVLLEWARP